MNISVISACNNNCEYCFQKDYHTMNKKLSLEEIDEIFYWGRYEHRIGILGGEPTLHPDIVEIVKRAKQITETCLFTNLLCKQDVLSELIKIPDVGYLVNTTTREELKDLFWSNVEFLYSNNDYLNEHNIDFSFGLTLMNEPEIDNRNIENIFKLVDAFPGFSKSLRMGIATPFHKGTFELMNYNEPVKYMIDKVLKDYPNLSIGFDCPSNNCQISPRLMGDCLEEPQVESFSLECTGAIFDILVDKSLKYCFSFPDDFLRIDSYTRFKDSREAHRWFNIKVKEYMSKYAFQCKKNKECDNDVCKGTCPAVNEYLRRQNNQS